MFNMFLMLLLLCAHCSDIPHCEPPHVEEPAPDAMSVGHNSEDGTQLCLLKNADFTLLL